MQGIEYTFTPRAITRKEFTFKAAKKARVRGGVSGFSYCAKIDGQLIVMGWAPGTRENALCQARQGAEQFGFIDE